MNKRAFTLIELLVVISIVALLASIVLASLNAARDKGRMATAQQFATQVYHALSDQPGGLWRFEEGAGSTALDSTGNGTTGSEISTPTYVTDTPTGTGYSLSFNGANYVDLPATARPDFAAITEPGTPGYTMGSWIKVLGLPVTNSGYTVLRVGFHEGPYITSTGSANASIWFFDNTSLTLSSGVNVNDGKWHHLALSVNESTHKAYLFLDGQEVASQSYAKALRSYGTGSYRIGGNTSWYFIGLIDDAFILNGPIK